MSEKICKGCGELLQSLDENKKGYVPFEKLLVEGDLICKNCFRLKHYGVVPNEINDIDQYVKIVDNAIKKSDLILAIFDITDISSSIMDEILDKIREKDSIVVFNKLDALDNYYTKAEISAYFRNKMIENNIFPESFCFVSAKNRDGLNGILHKIKDYANGKTQINVCVLGSSNVGKSSILNKLIGTDKLTTSKYSGTTKKEIKTTVKYKNMKISFIDTPGIIPSGRMYELLPKDKSVKLLSGKKIQKTKVNINENQYLMFENLVYLKILTKCSIDVFSSKNVQIHITNETKVKELLNNGFFNLLSSEETKKYLENEFEVSEFEILKSEVLDIHGLGYIEPNRNIKIYITHPKNLKISIRESIKNANKRQVDEIW